MLPPPLCVCCCVCLRVPVVCRSIRLWREGKPAGELLGHDGPVLCLAVTEEGQLLSGSGDHTLRRWAGKSCTAVYRGHTDTVRCGGVVGRVCERLGMCVGSGGGEGGGEGEGEGEGSREGGRGKEREREREREGGREGAGRVGKGGKCMCGSSHHPRHDIMIKCTLCR